MRNSETGLTGNFGSLDVQAGLVAQLEPPVVTARIHVGERVVAHLTPGALGVGEGEGAPERTLDEVGVLPEHGVEGRVAGDRVAEGLHRLDVLLAVAWNGTRDSVSYILLVVGLLMRR